MTEYCGTPLIRRRTEIPGEILTDTPAAELELRAASSSSARISGPGLKIAGGAPDS